MWWPMPPQLSPYATRKLRKMNAHEAANYSDNGAHNMTAEERAQGLEGDTTMSPILPHRLTNNSNNH